MKLSIIENIPVLALDHLKKIRSMLELNTFHDIPQSTTEVLERARDADIIALKWSPMADEVYDLTNLKHIITLSSGYNSFNLELARSKGINVMNCPEHNSNAVAEHAIAMMFALAKRLDEADTNIASGLWRKTPYDYLDFEISGKVLMQIGYGSIGSKIGDKAHALGADVIKIDSKTSKTDLNNALREADFVCLALPRNKHTLNMISAAELEQMKPSAYIINVARGGIINEDDLYQAIVNKGIAGAGLDVFNEEPVIGDTPASVMRFAKLPNVIVTPHVAYNTIEGGIKLGEELVNNVEGILSGNLVNVVN